MSETVKHTPGRWVYTSAIPEFEGHTDKVTGYFGSIHAGWEDSTVFETQDAFYDWAKAECARRNTIETAAPVMLEALIHAEAILSYATDFSTNKGGTGPNTNTRIARDKVRAAIALATGDRP